MATAAYDPMRSRSMFGGMAPAAPRNTDAPDLTRYLEEMQDAEAERLQHVTTWRSAMNLMMPDRQGFDQQTPGQQRIPQELVESHPIGATMDGVGNIIGAMTPPENDWAKLEPGSGLEEKQREALGKGCEKITEVFFDHLGRSNYSTEAHAAGYDLMISTGFLAMEMGTPKAPFRFKACSLMESLPVAGPDGALENNYRRYSCRPSWIKRKWAGAKLSSRIATLALKDPKARVTIVEAVVMEPGRGWRFVVFDPADKAVLYDVAARDPDEPCMMIRPRLLVRPGDTYGVGPCVMALPDVRKLNKLEELELKAGAKYASPSTLFDVRTGLNPHTIRLGGNYVGMINGAALAGDAPFHAIPANGVPQWSENKEVNLKRQIEKMLFADAVLPSAEAMKDVTAFAISVYRQQLLLQRGVNLGRLQRELPYAVMNRGVWILAKLGLIPPIKVDGRIFAVRPMGPLAQAQESQKAQQKLAWASAVRNSVGDQAAAVSVKVANIGANAGKLWPGVDSEDYNNEDERTQIQVNAAKAVAAQQAAGAAPTLDQTKLPGVA